MRKRNSPDKNNNNKKKPTKQHGMCKRNSAQKNKVSFWIRDTPPPDPPPPPPPPPEKTTNQNSMGCVRETPQIKTKQKIDASIRCVREFKTFLFIIYFLFQLYIYFPFQRNKKLKKL